MATDKSEPRVGLILQIGGFACVTLIVVHALLVAYFDRMARAEEYRKVGSAKPAALMSIRADETQRLAGGPMPIGKAVEMLATQGRTGAGADLMPKPSKDMAPLQGWVKMPGEVPAAMTATSPEAPPAPGAASLDGGTDGSATAVPGRSRDQDAGARDGAAPKRPHKNP